MNNQHIILATLLVIESLFVMTLALIVYFKNSRLETNIVFCCLGITGFIFLFSSAMMLLSREDAFILAWDRSIYIGVVFMPSLIYHLGVSFAKKIRQNRRWITLGYFFSLIFLSLSRTGSFLNGIFRYQWGVHAVAQPLHHIFIVVFSAYIFAYLLTLYKYYNKTASGEKRNQTKYLLFASSVLVLTSIQFLPAYKISVYPIGYFFIGAYLAIVAYAIIKHRLMDITLVITRTAIFAVVYTLVLGLPFILVVLGKNWLIGILGINWWLGPLAVMVVLASVGPFAYIYLLKRAEAILLREQRNYQETLKQAAIGIARIRNSKELLDYLAHTVTKTLHISHSAIYLFDEKSGQFLLKAGRNLKKEQPASLGRESSLITWLERHKEPLVYEEIKRRSEDDPDPIFKHLEEEMRLLSVTVVVASFLDDRLLDILILGDKLSGRVYTSEDLDNFSVLVSEAALAIENALRYENIEEQVRQRTKELVQVQKQLVQAEKLATVGILAGGVAHEINNPLAAILTNVQMLLADKSSGAMLDGESLELIEEATKRCRTIVQKLMAYAKRPLETADVSRVDLLNIIKNAISFLNFQLEQENVKITVNAKEDSYLVNGNQNELEQVVTNLVLNAKDAIKRVKKSGAIDISLLKSSDWIKMMIKDEGSGIPGEIISKIFDPFFTTKDVGKGLGLGLSICQAIMEKHNGLITVQSEINKGSVFTVQLPRIKEESKIKSGAPR